MILLIDNYDSFVHNLARYLRRMGQETLVVRNTEIDVAGIEELAPQAVVLSPGPCTPNEAGCSLNVVRSLGASVPILGVCLGHQTIGAALGAKVVRAPQPVHGRASLVRHDGAGVFAGLPSPLTVGRYHSLIVDPATLPEDLVPTAWSDEGVVMALAHRRWPLVGVQFHPESILTECGYELLANFLRLAGLHAESAQHEMNGERRIVEQASPALPLQPVTF
ncbi:MAG TPA: aminodeoxychorismate/anthranilate synthase component II [Pirellulaceae bacterium]|nr:aminodeoxychorismate/anthranilate synthase component II [Pirellulaceae bacterium]